MQIRKIVRVPDDYGGTAREDTNLIQVWCSVEPASAREVYQHSQLRQHVTHTVMTRWRDDIRQGQTVQIEGENHYVVAVTNPDRRKRDLRIVTRVGGPL